MIVIAAGAVLGGADRLCGNRLGYGDKFEEAFRLLGPMALSMAGMICLAPVLAGVLGRVIVPFYRGLGVDPAMFGGVLAIDMGGYQLGIVKCKILVCTVLRDGKAVAPDGNFVLREGDRIFVTAPSNELATLLHNLGIITHKVKRVLVCGGGRVTIYLAKQLEKSGIAIQIVEQDPKRCVDLASMLPYAEITQGDASNELLLESEGVASCDALATLTGIDELNMIISLYGSSCGVPQIITKLGRVNNKNILENLSLGSIISPRELCCNTIVRYVRAMQNQTGAAKTVYSIADGQAEAMEFLVDENTRHCGEPLKRLQLKKNVLVACITKGVQQEIPNGDSSFERGDTVIIVTNGDRVIYQLNDIFE